MKIIKTTFFRVSELRTDIEIHWGLGDDGLIYYNFFSLHNNDYEHKWKKSGYDWEEISGIYHAFKNIVPFI